MFTFIKYNITLQRKFVGITSLPCEIKSISRSKSIHKMTEVPEYRFKIVLIGSSGVGKTAISHRMIGKEFSDESKATVGVDYQSIQRVINGSNCLLDIWDTAGQEQYRSISKTYFRNAVGCILVFDLSSMDSFNELSYWLKQFREMGDPNAPIVLVGNKSDLLDTREVSSDAADRYANENYLQYIETSAKNAEHIEEVFERLSTQIYEKVINGTIKIKNTSDKNQRIETSFNQTGTCGC